MTTTRASRSETVGPGHFPVGAMAAAFLGADVDAPDGPARAAIEKMAGDLCFLLAQLDVPAWLHARVGELGYYTLAEVEVMAGDRATLRAMLVADFLLDPAAEELAADLQACARLLQTRMVAAWMAACMRASEEAKASADHRALRLPLVLPRGSLVTLRIKFEAQFGRVPYKETRAADWEVECIPAGI